MATTTPACTLSQWLRTYLIICLCLFQPVYSQETFTDSACRAATTAMNSCAQRWDSVRQECKERISTNTVWPGPCECSYFANDLPCFEEEAICAPQVWTQVPQWFRDGVTSCIMQDMSYTIRANLGFAAGVMGNPFTVKDLRGSMPRTSSSINVGVITVTATAGATASIPSQTGAPQRENEQMSRGAKAGFGVGIGVGVILIAIVAFLIVRNRKKRIPTTDAERKLSPIELHNNDSHMHQVSSDTIYSRNELQGTPKFELNVRASTWLVEMPLAHSKRGSTQQT